MVWGENGEPRTGVGRGEGAMKGRGSHEFKFSHSHKKHQENRAQNMWDGTRKALKGRQNRPRISGITPITYWIHLEKEEQFKNNVGGQTKFKITGSTVGTLGTRTSRGVMGGVPPQKNWAPWDCDIH